MTICGSQSLLLSTTKKGAVGGTTLALAYADGLAIATFSPFVKQVEGEQRLSAELSACVVTICP